MDIGHDSDNFDHNHYFLIVKVDSKQLSFHRIQPLSFAGSSSATATSASMASMSAGYISNRVFNSGITHIPPESAISCESVQRYSRGSFTFLMGDIVAKGHQGGMWTRWQLHLILICLSLTLCFVLSSRVTHSRLVIFLCLYPVDYCEKGFWHISSHIFFDCVPKIVNARWGLPPRKSSENSPKTS